MKLKKVIINKYKTFETVQKVEIESDYTALVGMNESGKTCLLEAITKVNPYRKNEDSNFDTSGAKIGHFSLKS